MKHPQRKYRISILAFALITLAYIATDFSDRLKDSFLTYIGGVGTILTLYGAANVSNKWVLAKNGILNPTDGSAVVINPQNQVIQSVPSAPISPGNKPLKPEDVSGA